MWPVMLKNLRAHRGRLFRTAIAVMLGVAFVSGTYVLTDTMSHLFDGIMTQATAGVDLYVRGHAAFVKQLGADSDRQPVSEGILGRVRGVPGVALAEGSVGGFAQLVGRDGKAIATSGAPTFGISWADPPLSPIVIRDGRKPENASEMVIDVASARRYGFKVGDQVGVLLNGPAQRFTLVGLAGFGANDNMAGATMAVFDLRTAQRVFSKEGLYDSIEIAAKGGVSMAQLQSRVTSVLPQGFEVVSAARVAKEQAEGIELFLGFFKTALLVFALIALFVGAFIIFNTFSIVVAQRTKEFALLRSLGASPRQVMWSVAGEALLVGLVASTVGLGLGVILALGLQAMLKAMGMELPSSSLQFLPRTVYVSLALGCLVTLAAALAPARKAARVPPLAAVRDVAAQATGSLRRRTIVGAAVTLVGVSLLLVGLFGGVSRGILLVGAGALLLFLGVAAFSPVIAGPVAAAIAAPLPKLTGVSGHLARENALRNRRRTATTAAALMVGVALISFVTVFSSSIKASATQGLNNSLRAEYVVTSSQTFGPPRPFSPDIAPRLTLLPAVFAVSPLRIGEWRSASGATKQLSAVDPRTVKDVLALDVQRGSVNGINHGGVLITDTVAKEDGLEPGDSLVMQFSRTGRQRLTVAGVFANDAAVQTEFVISLAEYERNYTDRQDIRVYVKGQLGIPMPALQRAIGSVTREFPNVQVMDQAQLKHDQEVQIDRLLGLVTALLGLALVIALIGIANTLGLSIMERTRELGLLRAVGMSRRQTRSMIRWEALIITLFGSVLGLGVGLFFGWAVVAALRDQGITVLSMPAVRLIVSMIVAGLAGVVAALSPARKAARLDVLTAIASE